MFDYRLDRDSDKNNISFCRNTKKNLFELFCPSLRFVFVYLTMEELSPRNIPIITPKKSKASKAKQTSTKTSKAKKLSSTIIINLCVNGEVELSEEFDRNAFIDEIQKSSNIQEINVDVNQFIAMDKDKIKNFKKAFNFLRTVTNESPEVFRSKKNYAFHTETGIQLIYLSKLAIPPTTMQYLKESISICIDARLAYYVSQYPWYLDASRRAVTLSHVSSEGLAKDVVQVVGTFRRANQALGFALSPTTIHDDIVTSPSKAPYFTYDPTTLTDKSKEYKSEYTSILTEECLKQRVESGSGLNHGILGGQQSTQMALERLHEFIKPIFGNEGDKSQSPKGEPLVENMKSSFVVDTEKKSSSQSKAAEKSSITLANLGENKKFFPWTHPELADTGCIIAGGLIGALFYDEPRWEKVKATTDIDIFVYGPDEASSQAMFLLITEHFESIGATFKHFYSVVRVILEGAPDIQIICPHAKSPLGVLVNFDFTSIQIAYQGAYDLGIKKHTEKFMATPGYCYFTPRGESYMTRYNIRFVRLMKVIERGFNPVASTRGHYLFPGRVFVSSQWRITIEDEPKRDDAWILNRTKTLVLREKHITIEDLIEKGIKNKKGKIVRTLDDLDMEHSKLFKPSVIERLTATAKEAAENYNFTYRHAVTIKDEKGIVQRYPMTTRKQDMNWCETTHDKLKDDFKPQGSTFIHGFDIYTEGINSTIALPEDGHPCSGLEHVFLRNIRILPEQSTYNLAAPKETPLEVAHVPFEDFVQKYPGNICYKPDSEPYRKIEGILLFDSIDTIKARKEEYILKHKEHIAEMEENRLKYLAEEAKREEEEKAKKEDEARKLLGGVVKADQQAKHEETPDDEGSEEEDDDEKETAAPPNVVNGMTQRNPFMTWTVDATQDPPKPITIMDLMRRDQPPQQIPQPSIIGAAPMSQFLQQIPQPSILPLLPVMMPKPNLLSEALIKAQSPQPIQQPSGVPILVANNNNNNESVPEPTPIEFGTGEYWNKEFEDRWNKQKIYFTGINPCDLHRYIEESDDLKTIPIHEVPFMIKAFSEGKAYGSRTTGCKIFRSDKMVKVTAVVAFNPCVLFDVDEHLRPHSTLDDCPHKFYNGVVRFKNMMRWVVEPHDHKDALTHPSSRAKVVELLGEEVISTCNKVLSNPRGKAQPYDPTHKLPLSQVMRITRDICNSEKFEAKVAKAICFHGHADKGLLGEMPVLVCTRLYVSKTE